MKHKHYEVLLAIADGKEVEFKSKVDDTWETGVNNNPITNHFLEWRVKKEPVIDVKYFTMELYVAGLYFEEIKTEIGEEMVKWDLKITLQDGKPIKAELPEDKP